jgi:hypothetical protein
MRCNRVLVLVVGALWVAIGSPAADGQTYSGFAIDGRANIFGAGFGDAPAPGGGSGGLPPPVADITLPGPVVLRFSSVTGLVRSAVPEPQNGPDGGTSSTGTTDILSHRDVSGIVHPNRTLFLVGVFRDAGAAAPGGPAPARLSFGDPENFLTLSPQVNQTFFIGDGLTDDTAAVQTFVAPPGATRLFLGFEDAFDFGNPSAAPGHYGDNSGEFTADFAFTPVPEPAALALVVAPAALACRRRRRRPAHAP